MRHRPYRNGRTRAGYLRSCDEHVSEIAIEAVRRHGVMPDASVVHHDLF